MDIDKFIEKLEEYNLYGICILIKYDSIIAEIECVSEIMYIKYHPFAQNMDWKHINGKGAHKFPISYDHLYTHFRQFKTYTNPYHWTVIHLNSVKPTLKSFSKIKSVIENVYNNLPSKVDIGRYKNDFDLEISYL